jgi:pimeloyl-ACP methyl ester carboxylesterase
VAARKLKRAGIAGLGVAGGLAVQHAVVRHLQKAPEVAPLAELETPDGVRAHFVPVSDGGSIFVIEHGPRRGTPAVLLLHGITLSSAVWAYQLRDLAEAGYRAAALDFRGHGRSRVGTDELTIDRLAADVVEVMAALDMEKVVLAGHSMGGMVALRLLARDPSAAAGAGRIQALVLAATSASPVRRRGVPLARAVVAVAAPLLIRTAAVTARLPGRTLPAHDLAFLLARITFGADASPGQVSFTGELTSEVAARVSAQLLLEILRFDEEQSLGSIHLPTSVIVGDHDLMTPPSHARGMAERIPGAQLLILEGAGHMVMLERRHQVDEVLLGLAGAVGAAVPSGSGGG